MSMPLKGQCLSQHPEVKSFIHAFRRTFLQRSESPTGNIHRRRWHPSQLSDLKAMAVSVDSRSHAVRIREGGVLRMLAGCHASALRSTHLSLVDVGTEEGQIRESTLPSVAAGIVAE